MTFHSVNTYIWQLPQTTVFVQIEAQPLFHSNHCWPSLNMFPAPTPLKVSLSCLLSLPPATVLVRASLGCSLLLRCVVAGLSFHRGAFLATITSHKHFVFRILTNQCLNVRWSWRSYIYLPEGCYGTPVNPSFLEPQCAPCHLLILWFMFDLFHLT